MGGMQIRQKRGSSSIIEWALGQGLEDDAVQWQELLRAVTTAILTAGAKTITHMATYVERFEALMRFLMLKCPSQVCLCPSQQVRTCSRWCLLYPSVVRMPEELMLVQHRVMAGWPRAGRAPASAIAYGPLLLRAACTGPCGMASCQLLSRHQHPLHTSRTVCCQPFSRLHGCIKVCLASGVCQQLHEVWWINAVLEAVHSLPHSVWHDTSQAEGVLAELSATR